MSGRSTRMAALCVGGFVLCCILTVVILDVHGATLYPANRLSIVDGAGFLMYLVPDHAVGDSMEVISRCSLTLGDQSYNLDTDKVYTIGQSTTVQRFNADVCGIRVHNVRASSDTAWTITALGDRSNQVNHTMTLTVIEPRQHSEINITVSDLDSSVTVDCPNSSSIYCRILDEAGNIYDGCSRTFDITWEQARFRCQMLDGRDMAETETVIDVRVKSEENEFDVSWSTKENENHVVLSCHYSKRLNPYKTPCRAVSKASRRQILLKDGYLAGRYSSYNTKSSKGICALEIQKPLIKEDIGVWRIYMLIDKEYTGCVFDLSDHGTEIEYEPQLQPQLIEVFHDSRPFDGPDPGLECESPYPLSYCYLSGPHGERLKPIQFQNLGSLGICRFDISTITTGEWACGRNDNSGGEDHFTYYDVKAYDEPGRAISPQITANSGDENRDLLCKTILDLPIDVCRFVSPTGEFHDLSEHIIPAPDSRFKYHGKGLRKGECGLQIKQLKREDFGRWRCSIIVQDEEDYTFAMDVIEEDVTITTPIVAICIGVTLVSSFVGGFFAYRKLNRPFVPYR